MKKLFTEKMNLNQNNENILNCKDIKLQILSVYQIFYWGIVLIFNLFPINIEVNLEKLIIVTLSCISVILIGVVTFDVLAKSKYKWSGVPIIFLASTIALLYNYVM